MPRLDSFRLDQYRIDSVGGEYGTATAADVLEGKTIGTEDGVIPGTLKKGKQFASGTIISSGFAQFPNYGGANIQSPYIAFDFANLPFTPSLVEFLRTDRQVYRLGTVWHFSNFYNIGSQYANSGDGTGSAFRVPYSRSVVKIPCEADNLSYDWWAYE